MSTDLHILSGAYALDAVSPHEASEFFKHMQSCPPCNQEVAELQRTAAALGECELAVPPAHLKPRVLAAAGRVPQQRPRSTATEAITSRRTATWMPKLVAAAVAMILLAGIGFLTLRPQQEDYLAADVTEVFAASDVHKGTLRTRNDGEIAVAVSEDLGKMALDTHGLPALGDDRVYQVWAVSGRVAKSAGLVEDIDKGTSMTMPVEPISVAITIEPVGGSTKPTTTPIVEIVPSAV